MGNTSLLEVPIIWLKCSQSQMVSPLLNSGPPPAMQTPKLKRLPTIGSCVHQIQDHSHFVQGVSWDPLNEYLATQSSDR